MISAVILSFATAVYGHGYLTTPMSRTGLNAEVRRGKQLGLTGAEKTATD